MSFLDQLRAARRSTVAVFHEFTLLYNAASDLIHAFVEGQPDQDHFSPELKRRSGPSGVKAYVCNGKKGVYEVAAKATAKYELNNRVIFIVDRDYDDFVPVTYPSYDAMYTTDFYAIENELACEETLDFFLHESICIDKSDQSIGLIKEQYRKITKEFSDNMKDFSALVICEKRNKIKVNLNNVTISHAFQVDGNINLIVKADPTAILGRECDIPSGTVTKTQLDEQVAVLNDNQHKLWVRGKFEMWLFLNFLNQVWFNLSKVGRPDGRTIKQSFHFNDQNVYMFFSGRVPYQKSFLDFLDRRLGTA